MSVALRSSKLVSPSGEKYTEEEFNEVLDAVSRIMKTVVDNYKELATILYYCTPVQRCRLKKFLKNNLSTAFMDRLYYYGIFLVLGDTKVGMAAHLAVGESGRNLRKATWERLSLETKRSLNDPDFVVAVARQGTTPKRVSVKNLRTSELQQILGDEKILTVDQQLSKIRYREVFEQGKSRKDLLSEVPEKNSQCERTNSIVLAKNKVDLIFISENHRQHARLDMVIKFIKDSGYMVYKKS